MTLSQLFISMRMVLMNNEIKTVSEATIVVCIIKEYAWRK